MLRFETGLDTTLRWNKNKTEVEALEFVDKLKHIKMFYFEKYQNWFKKDIKNN